MNGQPATERARNVILIIADGMSQTHVDYAAYTMFGSQSMTGNAPPRLAFEEFGSNGLLTTYCLNSFVSESASCGTAMATGRKTNLWHVGVGPDWEPMDTIAEIADRRGKGVGIVTNMAVNHATPATFYAKVMHRRLVNEIWQQFFEVPFVDVILGGAVLQQYPGEEIPDHEPIPESEIVAAARGAGYLYFTLENLEELDPVAMSGRKVFGTFDDTPDDHMVFATSRTLESREPELAELSVMALDLLRAHEEGFFLMIEAGTIDLTGHRTDPEILLGEMKTLHETVLAVRKWLEETGRAEETLVIVCADHDCGGPAMVGPIFRNLEPGQTPEIRYAVDNHTAVSVPIWATGPGAWRVRGKNDNTHVFTVMLNAFGFY
ncbi:MAG: alkaline phosphatase [Sumerlaeia bacterium]